MTATNLEASEKSEKSGEIAAIHCVSLHGVVDGSPEKLEEFAEHWDLVLPSTRTGSRVELGLHTCESLAITGGR